MGEFEWVTKFLCEITYLSPYQTHHIQIAIPSILAFGYIIYIIYSSGLGHTLRRPGLYGRNRSMLRNVIIVVNI